MTKDEMTASLLAKGVPAELHEDVFVFVLTGEERRSFSKAFDYLYDYYVREGEMPYGVAKARTDDPYNWISKQLQDEWE